jgi:2'-5' RNA ligase
VWLGLADGEPELAALATAVNRGLTHDDAGHAAHPHITVARELPPGASNALLERLRPLAGAAWRVERAYLYRSHLGAGGSRYEALAELSLRGRTETF